MATPIYQQFEQQWRYFRLALQFFTRIPVGHIADFKEADLNKASRYFSLVGLTVALLLALTYHLLSGFLPLSVTVVLLLVVSVLITGAFHEDGLADMADGIGGGYTVEKRLTIMKDSRLGTYGALAIVLPTALKLVLFFHLAELELLVFALLLSHALSRAVAGSLIFDTPYVTEDSESKSKPLAQQQSSSDCWWLFAIALMPLVVAPTGVVSISFVFYLALVLLVFRWLFKRWIMARLGGFTGDCLGGAQQMAELLIALFILSMAGGLG
ncbi:adenosylcobinamide-GDP ribazoletransferase [Thalassotalea marina]|uniref:Adenosylcobinamide-GDP ribazoletransferase n=1 Tax=Thalassotalea marina TaxID=1673741 RepID=A0A919BAI0_9GAMM|nr:adenosylcobinamide-GDP ribazoletransferase [Thalassotalea marina]GHF78973.1 adenosylcobinamide-GDP ribazoletransferase [Thalassotalea marina]